MTKKSPPPAQYLSIGETARRTGLSVRALRHYEDEGLLNPQRTQADRRVYGAEEMLILMQISLLRKAGFAIAKIREALTAPQKDVAAILAAQIALVQAERDQANQALTLLTNAKRHADAGDAISTQDLCLLIKSADEHAQQSQWQKIYDRYYSPKEQEEWATAKQQWAQSGAFNPEATQAAWRDLAQRIEAALPLDPACPKAQKFLDEWNVLMEPFMKMASPSMVQGASKLWGNLEDWHGDADQPLTPEIVNFIRAVSATREIV